MIQIETAIRQTKIAQDTRNIPAVLADCLSVCLSGVVSSKTSMVDDSKAIICYRYKALNDLIIVTERETVAANKRISFCNMT